MIEREKRHVLLALKKELQATPHEDRGKEYYRKKQEFYELLHALERRSIKA